MRTCSSSNSKSKPLKQTNKQTGTIQIYFRNTSSNVSKTIQMFFLTSVTFQLLLYKDKLLSYGAIIVVRKGNFGRFTNQQRFLITTRLLLVYSAQWAITQQNSLVSIQSRHTTPPIQSKLYIPSTNMKLGISSGTCRMGFFVLVMNHGLNYVFSLYILFQFYV